MTGEPASPPGVDLCWRLVMPIKESGEAKSRLGASHPLVRPVLARAVAQDTLTAVCAALPARDVVVVTTDDHASRFAARLGARVVADPGSGLNAAIRAGLAVAAQDGEVPAPDPRPAGYAVLLGDLPALRAADLLLALGRCSAYPTAVVPDADGTGTVLLTSTVGPPEPHFGAGSAARHAERGTLLPLDLPRLRRDVDTADDLAAAGELGVGPATARALRHPHLAAYSGGMQATVHAFDLDTRSGQVLLDTGKVLPFSAEVFEASGLRHLRLGQRVSIVASGDPEDEGTELARLWIVGIGSGQPIA